MPRGVKAFTLMTSDPGQLNSTMYVPMPSLNSNPSFPEHNTKLKVGLFPRVNSLKSIYLQD